MPHGTRFGGFAYVCTIPKGHQKYTHHGVGVGTGLQRSFFIFRTLSNALRFLWSGAVLRSASCWGISCFMAQVELCFLPEFSYFSQKSERIFLTSTFLTFGRPLSQPSIIAEVLGSSLSDSDFSHIMSFFSRYRSCRWIALQTCEHSERRWLILFPQQNINQYRTRTGMGGLRERNLVM